MNRLTGTLLFICMLFNAEISAQENLVHSVDWKIAAKIPATPEQQKSLGFAGSVVGIIEDMLIVAGGANFPNGMPWQGGKKKYYDDVFVYKLNGNKIKLLRKPVKLPSKIAYAASCSISNGIVYAGGETDDGISNTVILAKWNKTTSSLTFQELPKLPI